MTTGTDTTKAQQEGSSVADTQCAGTIPIIPVRYAIVPRKDDSQPDYLYADKDCGARLEQGFEKLSRSIYTVRALRPGYIYLYDEARGNLFIWEADGKGNYKELRYTSLENYQLSDKLSAGRTLKNVWAFEDSGTVHIGFTTNLLTQKMVLKVEQDPAFRSKFMHPVKVKELNDWSEQPTTQKHMFGLADAPNIIEEYKGKVTDFGWSNYKEQEQTSISQYEKLALDYHEKSRSKVPAFIALYDNEAMTQDVGNIAAQHIHEITDALQRVKTGEGGELPDTVLLDTSDISAASTNLYRKKMIYENLKQTLVGGYQKDKLGDIPKLSRLAKETLQYYKGGSRNSPRKVTDSEAELYTLSNKSYNKQAEEILAHLDEKKMDKFHADWDNLEEKVALLKPKARNALADHAYWLKTAEPGNESTPTALGATLATYDNTNVHSAFWFEMTTALCISGMGGVIPNDMEFEDERDKLLDRWMKDRDSLIYQSILAFEPTKKEFRVFKDKLDSTGDILGGVTTGLEALHKKFPYTFATDHTAIVVTSYGMRKLDKSIKWNGRDFFTLIKKQLSANHTQAAIQMLGMRYNLSKASVLEHPITKKTNRWINQATTKAPTKSTSKINTTLNKKGNTITLSNTKTTTKTTTKISANLLREIGKAPLGALVSYLHYLNLASAISEFSEKQNGLSGANLLSAALGTAGAFGESAVGLRAIANKTIPTNKIVAKATQNTVFKIIASKAFIRVTGYIGAAAEAAVQIIDAVKFFNKGDYDAMGWSVGAGLTLGAGGALLTAGTIVGMKAAAASSVIATGTAAAAGSAAVPGIGWIVAGVILVGLGIYCIIQKSKNTDTPFQIWLNRSYLGINDLHVGAPFKSSEAENKAYFALCYSPRQLDELPDSLKDKRIINNASNSWHENGTDLDKVEFLLHLPGYRKGQSDCEFRIYSYNEDDVEEDNYKKHEALKRYATGGGRMIYHSSGVILNIQKTIEHIDVQSAMLEIKYWPNKSVLSESITGRFFLDD